MSISGERDFVGLLMGISSGNSCHCKAETGKGPAPLLAPLRGKMKVLKKIKRKMGLG